jgi:osmotically-inducible protein OsmY
MREVGEVRDRMRLPAARELSDKQIVQHIGDAFAQDPTLRRREFMVRATDGVVTLTGLTDSIEEKRFAGVLAWWVPGVADVDNRITVEPEHVANDGDLADIIRQVFEKDVLVDPERIGVMVQDGVVTLVGTVRSDEERMAAEHDCYYIFGVDEVVNQLTVTAE